MPKQDFDFSGIRDATREWTTIIAIQTLSLGSAFCFFAWYVWPMFAAWWMAPCGLLGVGTGIHAVWSLRRGR